MTEDAAASRITVQRGDTTQTVDAYAALKEGQPLNFTLREGDYIVVPENTNRVLIMEAVAKPGYYPIPEKGRLTLLDALGAAGGPSAKTKEVVLLRKTPTGVQKQVIPMERVRSGTASVETLQNGDVIYVPTVTAKTSILNNLMSTLGIFRIFIP